MLFCLSSTSHVLTRIPLHCVGAIVVFKETAHVFESDTTHSSANTRRVPLGISVLWRMRGPTLNPTVCPVGIANTEKYSFILSLTLYIN